MRIIDIRDNEDLACGRHQQAPDASWVSKLGQAVPGKKRILEHFQSPKVASFLLLESSLHISQTCQCWRKPHQQDMKGTWVIQWEEAFVEIGEIPPVQRILKCPLANNGWWRLWIMLSQPGGQNSPRYSCLDSNPASIQELLLFSNDFVWYHIGRCSSRLC